MTQIEWLQTVKAPNPGLHTAFEFERSKRILIKIQRPSPKCHPAEVDPYLVDNRQNLKCLSRFLLEVILEVSVFCCTGLPS